MSSFQNNCPFFQFDEKNINNIGKQESQFLSYFEINEFRKNVMGKQARNPWQVRRGFVTLNRACK